MRPALQRLLVSTSALRVLSNCLESPNESLLGLGKKSSCLGCTYGSRIYGRQRSSGAALAAEEDEKDSRRQHPTTQHHSIAGCIQRGPVAKVPFGESNASLRWSDRLETFEQFQYESDLDTAATQGPRLVDQADFSNDFELWLQLLRFRRRTHGNSGVATIWNGILKRDIDLPTTGPVADELWDAFLNFSFQRRDLANKLFKYVSKLHETIGRAWPSLYLKILEHELETVSPHCYRWHQRLQKDFPPTFEHLQILFKKAMSSKQALRVFKSIYMELPFRRMYSTIVPSLCEEGMYISALTWHNLLMRSDDLPSSSVIAEPLLHHLAIYGDEGELTDITEGMVNAGVSFARPVGTHLKKNAIISREIMNRIHGEILNIAPKTLNDGFCARFFATSVFPVDMVISVLKILGHEEIGPLSLRELAIREKSASAVSHRIAQLQEAGISIGVSRFSRTVESLAEKEDEELLRDLLASDQHPHELDNWKLQESLLAYYGRANDTLQYRRTLAVLTSNVPTKLVPQETWNLQLRSYARDRNIDAIVQTMEGMREARVMVRSKSCGYLRECLLCTRSPSKPAPRTDDLPVLVNIWQTILRDGGFLLPITWREILRRYGMAGRLDELEKLAVWLASWYSDPIARARQMSRTRYCPHQGKQYVAVQQLECLPTTHMKHPLRVIFTPQAQEAIVAWGFRRFTNQETPHESNDNAMPTYVESSTARWAWGLKLLVQLKQRGVRIETATIGAACRNRLVILFGDGVSARLVNRRIRANNPFTIEQIILGMEEIWGPTLFDSNKTLPPPGTHLRLQMIKDSILGAPPPQLLRRPERPPSKENDWISFEDLEYPPLFSAG